MGLFKRQAGTASGAATLTLIQGGLDDTMTRYEGLGESARPADPYAAWLQERDAERERGAGESTRWVYRPRAVGAAVVSS